MTAQPTATGTARAPLDRGQRDAAGPTKSRARARPASGGGGSAARALARARARVRTWAAAARPHLEWLVAWWPTTFRGLWMGALAAVALRIYGYGSLDLLLYVVGLSGLILVAVAVAAVLGTAVHLKRRLGACRSEESRIECGSLIRTQLVVPALVRVPLVQVGWTWVTPRDVEVRPRLLGTRLYEEVVAHRRDLRREIVRRFEVRDAFGLARWTWQTTEIREMLLLPEARRLRHAAFVPSLASADGTSSPAGDAVGDRMEIRPYVPGDSVRNIIWTTFAKTGELVVRTPERSVDRSREVRAYLVAGTGDEPAAAAARVALEEGALGDRWTFGADGTEGTQTEIDDAIRAIARSGSVPAAEGGRGLATFDRARAGQAHCIVFAPGAFGPWTSRVLDLLHERPRAVSVVLGIDGFVTTAARPVWQRLLLAADRPRGPVTEHPHALVATLHRAGAHVVVADRTTGRYYGDQAALAQGASR